MSIKQFILVSFVAGALSSTAQESVTYTLDPSQVQSRADVGIHGQFLEHIFNSVHGGLWGDLVRNGSLEPNASGRGWSLRDESVVANGVITDDRVVFGSPAWTDYEFTLEARKLSGAEGFLPMFRVAPDRRHYWANLGGWGNKAARA